MGTGSKKVAERGTPSRRQKQIYVEAARLFMEKGFGSTSMSDLAEAVKLTKAGLYHSISSKEDLLFTVIQFGMDDFDDQVLNPALEIADPCSRLQMALALHVLNVTRVGDPAGNAGNPVTTIVDQVQGLSPARQRIVARRKYQYIVFLRDTLDELRKQGRLLDNLDTTVAALSLSAMVLGIAKWRRPGGRLAVAQISEQVVGMALHSVLKPEVVARAMRDPPVLRESS
ncbi:MAG: TetR/AcrR family transcriptional regulator [Alphaproteobacteria bacterium]|nr:TetR/AcrR family transcriptional regulator [Alphaproteobacteria bacterium]